MKHFAKRYWLVGFLGFFLFWALMLSASSGGKTGRTSLSDSPGCTCHGAQASSEVVLRLEGPDTLEVDKTASYTVSISGGPAVAAGTDIAVSVGTLTPVSGNLQKAGNELTHTTPVMFDGNSSVVFEFQITAPSSAGEMILAANGNSVNLDGSNGGDQWNFAPDKRIIIASPNAITGEKENMPKSFTLRQNYPNPFNPSTMIRYTLSKTSIVNLTIYNLAGQKIATPVAAQQSSGTYDIHFKASDLSSGVYLYRLTVDGVSATKRMMLLR